MTDKTTTDLPLLQETAVMQRFLDSPDGATFTELFRIFSPRLVAFFRARGSSLIAEDQPGYRAEREGIPGGPLFRAVLHSRGVHRVASQGGRQTRCKEAQAQREMRLVFTP